MLPVSIFLFGIEKGMRMMYLMGPEDAITIWEQGPYVILYWIRYFFMIFYYIMLVEKSLSLGDPVYYKPQKWLI